MKKRRILTALIVLNLAYIWGNSAMDGTNSSNVSGGVMAFLARFLPFLAGEAGHHFVRKAAHFSEFACLGLLSGWRMNLSGGMKPWLLGFGLAVACIDETIQIYVPGRASSLLDVWIDTSGFAVGMILLLIGYTIYKKRKLRRNTL